MMHKSKHGFYCHVRRFVHLPGQFCVMVTWAWLPYDQSDHPIVREHQCGVQLLLNYGITVFTVKIWVCTFGNVWRRKGKDFPRGKGFGLLLSMEDQRPRLRIDRIYNGSTRCKPLWIDYSCNLSSTFMKHSNLYFNPFCIWFHRIWRNRSYQCPRPTRSPTRYSICFFFPSHVIVNMISD